MAEQPIFGQTLGQLLQNNQQAQNHVMQAMQITPEQLQQLLSMTGNNQLMNMTIGDLFKNGAVQQAAQGQPMMVQGQAMQVSPQQMQQILQGLNLQGMSAQQVTQLQPNQTQSPQSSDGVQYTLPANPPKKSWWQKLLG